MRTILRTIHLYCTLILMAFVVMYFVTGYVLARNPLFGKPKETTSRRTVDLNAQKLKTTLNEAGFHAAIQEDLDIHGVLEPVQKQSDGTWRFNINRPGYRTEVVVAADLRSAKIAEQRFGWQRVFVGLHRLHGYGGGWLYDLWALFLDLASGAMIVFAITGIVLWHRIARNHLPGWILLAAGFVFTAGTIGYLYWMP